MSSSWARLMQPTRSRSAALQASADQRKGLAEKETNRPPDFRFGKNSLPLKPTHPVFRSSTTQGPRSTSASQSTSRPTQIGSLIHARPTKLTETDSPSIPPPEPQTHDKQRDAVQVALSPPPTLFKEEVPPVPLDDDVTKPTQELTLLTFRSCLSEPAPALHPSQLEAAPTQCSGSSTTLDQSTGELPLPEQKFPLQESGEQVPLAEGLIDTIEDESVAPERPVPPEGGSASRTWSPANRFRSFTPASIPVQDIDETEGIESISSPPPSTEVEPSVQADQAFEQHRHQPLSEKPDLEHRSRSIGRKSMRDTLDPLVTEEFVQEYSDCYERASKRPRNGFPWELWESLCKQSYTPNTKRKSKGRKSAHAKEKASPIPSPRRVVKTPAKQKAQKGKGKGQSHSKLKSGVKKPVTPARPSDSKRHSARRRTVP
jgi:hypothetical protein